MKANLEKEGGWNEKKLKKKVTNICSDNTNKTQLMILLESIQLKGSIQLQTI